MYRDIRSSSAVIATLLLIAVPATLAQTGTPSPAGGDGQKSIDILYTGRLLGYYRLPDTQSGDSRQAFSKSFPWCFDARTELSRPSDVAMSDPARKLRDTLQIQQYKDVHNRLLLGTGDNFAL